MGILGILFIELAIPFVEKSNDIAPHQYCVAGVVVDDKGERMLATAGIFRKPKSQSNGCTVTTVDGAYNVGIPADTTEFHIIAKKAGYLSGNSGPLKNIVGCRVIPEIVIEPLDLSNVQHQQHEQLVFFGADSTDVQSLILNDAHEALRQLKAGQYSPSIASRERRSTQTCKTVTRCVARSYFDACGRQRCYYDPVVTQQCSYSEASSKSDNLAKSIAGLEAMIRQMEEFLDGVERSPVGQPENPTLSPQLSAKPLQQDVVKPKPKKVEIRWSSSLPGSDTPIRR